MAKSEKKEPSKTKVHKIARQAGKIAAQAERIARDAVDKAVHASNMVVDVIGHPSQAADAVGKAVTAGRRTAAEIGTGTQHLLESGTSAVANSDVAERLSQLIDERLRATVHSLGLATRGDLTALSHRVTRLERANRNALPATPAPAKKRAVNKALPAAPTAPKKRAVKSAPAKKVAAKRAVSRKP
jgi:hypothetical protein